MKSVRQQEKSVKGHWKLKESVAPPLLNFYPIITSSIYKPLNSLILASFNLQSYQPLIKDHHLHKAFFLKAHGTDPD